MMRAAWVVPVLGVLLSACGDSGFLFLYEVPKPTHVPPHHEEFVVREIVRSQADILWVIDNSGSMAQFQRNVIANTHTFMQEFTQNAQYADWKMGLISTDVSQEPYLGFLQHDLLDANSPNPVARFQDAVRRLGTYGSGIEKTYEPVVRTLERYSDFLRKGAILALIVVTDAEEQSRMSTDEFLRNIHARVSATDKFVVYTVLGDGSSGCPTDEYFRYPGSRYEEFVQKTGAKLYSLCSDFGTSLAEIGRDIGRRMEAARLDLNEWPVFSTLKVYYKDQELPGGPAEAGGHWIYKMKQNSIVFHDLRFANGDFEKVRVTYQTAR